MSAGYDKSPYILAFDQRTSFADREDAVQEIAANYRGTVDLYRARRSADETVSATHRVAGAAHPL